MYYIQMNFKNELLKNKDIRKAIDSGYDKAQMAEVLLNNGSIPAYYYVPKEFAKGPDGKDFRDGNEGFGSYDASAAKASFEKGLKDIGKKSVKLDFFHTMMITRRKSLNTSKASGRKTFQVLKSRSNNNHSRTKLI